MNEESTTRLQDIVREALQALPAERVARLQELCGTDHDLYFEALRRVTTDGDDAWWEAASDDTDAKAARDEDAAPPDFNPGDRIGPYRVISILGEGGMGVVVLAERDDLEFEQTVAIKLVRRGLVSKQVKGRLKIERQILAALDHPNIAKLLDGGTWNGTPYIVMEYVEGKPIDVYCDERRLSLRDRLRLFRQVCSAVHYAHQNLVVHRDLKPSNILVTSDGVPKLLDFGIAKLLDERQAMHTLAVTQADVRLLTPDHASPEQILGGPVTTASDVYVLGVLLYELLTGCRPFDVKSSRLSELENAICNRPPVAPSAQVVEAWRADSLTAEKLAVDRALPLPKLIRSIRGDLDNIVLMAMRKEPERRYSSVEQFATDIEHYLGSLPVLARADRWSYRATKFLQRHALGAALSSALIVLLVAFAVTSYIQAERVAKQRDLAAAERETAERQRERAERVSSFLVDIFQVSDPSEARGNEVKAREILDSGAQKIDHELADQPDVKATLLSTIGRVYHRIGLLGIAEATLRKALTSQQSFYGADDPALAATMSELAAVLMDRGNYKEAEPLYSQALELNTRKYGRDSEQVAESLSNLGRFERVRGDFNAAERYLTASLNAFQHGKRATDVVVTNIMNDLGNIAVERGDYARAEPLLQHAVEIDRAQRGADHPAYAYHLSNLALLHQAQGRFDAAGAEFEESLALCIKLFGEQHLETISAMSVYARFLGATGRFREAAAKYRRIADLNAEVLGERNEAVAYALVNLANVDLFIDQPAEAERLVRQALSIYAEHLAATNPRIGSATLVLGEALVAQGHVAEGEKQLERSLDILRKQYPDSSLYVAMVRTALGHARRQQGDLKGAEELLTANYAILRRGNQNTIYSRRAAAWLADVYTAQGKPSLAKPLEEAARAPLGVLAN